MEAAREKANKCSTTPKIFSKSIKLADIAYVKELNRLKQKSEQLHLDDVNDLLSSIEISIVDAEASLKSPPASSQTERRGREKQRFTSPSSASVRSDPTMSGRSLSASKLDVYNRLAIHGRIHAEEYKNYKPPIVPRVSFLFYSIILVIS